MLAKLTKKQNINFFMSSVLFTVLTLPLNMIPLWTKLQGKIQQVFFAPFKVPRSHVTFGESLYPNISKKKTSEGLSLSKQIKLIIYYCEISSVLWTSSKSLYSNVLVYELQLYLFHSSIQIKRIKFTFNYQDAHCIIYTCTISTHQKKKNEREICTIKMKDSSVPYVLLILTMKIAMNDFLGKDTYKGKNPKYMHNLFFFLLTYN